MNSEPAQLGVGYNKLGKKYVLLFLFWKNQWSAEIFQRLIKNATFSTYAQLFYLSLTLIMKKSQLILHSALHFAIKAYCGAL